MENLSARDSKRENRNEIKWKTKQNNRKLSEKQNKCNCIVVSVVLVVVVRYCCCFCLLFYCCGCWYFVMFVVDCCWLDVKDAESSLLLVVVIYMWRLQTAHFGGNSPAMCYRVHSTRHTATSHNMIKRCCYHKDVMMWCMFGDDRSRFMVTKQARTWRCIYKKRKWKGWV